MNLSNSESSAFHFKSWAMVDTRTSRVIGLVTVAVVTTLLKYRFNPGVRVGDFFIETVQRFCENPDGLSGIHLDGRRVRFGMILVTMCVERTGREQQAEDGPRKQSQPRASWYTTP